MPEEYLDKILEDIRQSRAQHGSPPLSSEELRQLERYAADPDYQELVYEKNYQYSRLPREDRPPAPVFPYPAFYNDLAAIRDHVDVQVDTDGEEWNFDPFLKALANKRVMLDTGLMDTGLMDTGTPLQLLDDFWRDAGTQALPTPPLPRERAAKKALAEPVETPEPPKTPEPAKRSMVPEGSGQRAGKEKATRQALVPIEQQMREQREAAAKKALE